MWWKKSRYVSQLISLNYPFIYVEEKENIAERLMEIYMSQRRDYKLSWKIRMRSLEKTDQPHPCWFIVVEYVFQFTTQEKRIISYGGDKRNVLLKEKYLVKNPICILLILQNSFVKVVPRFPGARRMQLFRLA